MQGRCLYCGVEGEMSREHTVPEALGDFGKEQILEGRVCTECNNAIGDATEVQFCRTGPNGFFRWLLAVEGKDGRPPSPFYRGAGGAPGVFVQGRPGGWDHDLLWEMEWGTTKVYPLRQILLRHELLGIVPVPLLDRMIERPELLRQDLLARGLQNAILSEIIAPDDEFLGIREALGRLDLRLAEGAPQALNFPEEGQEIQLTTFVHVTDSYFRAVAKVVFHHALTVLTDLSGAEPCFEGIRAYIRHGTGIRQGTGGGFVREIRQQFIANFELGQRPVAWSHVVAVDRNDQSIGGFAMFFVGPSSLPYPFRVYLGRNPSRLHMPRERHTHAFIIDNAGTGDSKGHVEDLNPVNPIIVP